jgi:hypothetical protein
MTMFVNFLIMIVRGCQFGEDFKRVCLVSLVSCQYHIHMYS